MTSTRSDENIDVKVGSAQNIFILIAAANFNS